MKSTLFKILAFGLSIFFIISCQEPKNPAKEKLMENINIAYSLLDIAVAQPETDLNIPMGFRLNCTEKEFKKHCDYLLKNNGGRIDYSQYYLNSKDFGGVEREVRISKFNYFSDPNTETDTIVEVTFIFDEFRNDQNSNGGWEVLRDSIGAKFDDSWETVEYDLNDAREVEYSISEDYHKFWVRGNMAVQFAYDGVSDFATLSFYNVPKYGTKFFKDDVDLTLQIQEEVQKKLKEKEAAKPKIFNSVWDGSVWQVETYLESVLKDPDSYEGISWGEVKQKGNKYEVFHKYRAKNSFGGYVVESYLFTLDENGEVIGTVKL